MTATAELLAADKLAAAAAAKWAAVIIAGRPVAVRPCTRCEAKGRIAAYDFNNFGICRLCGGDAVIPAYTKTQRAAIKREEALMFGDGGFFPTMNERIHRHDRTNVVFPNGRTESVWTQDVLRNAFYHLKENAPARFARLLDSLEAGRFDAIAEHLLTYAADNGIVA